MVWNWSLVYGDYGLCSISLFHNIMSDVIMIFVVLHLQLLNWSQTGFGSSTELVRLT